MPFRTAECFRKDRAAFPPGGLIGERSRERPLKSLPSRRRGRAGGPHGGRHARPPLAPRAATPGARRAGVRGGSAGGARGPPLRSAPGTQRKTENQVSGAPPAARRDLSSHPGARERLCGCRYAVPPRGQSRTDTPSRSTCSPSTGVVLARSPRSVRRSPTPRRANPRSHGPA
jgi:hypothetical protein